MTLDPGARLGQYEIVAPLGAGGMGEVYRARDSKLKRDVAIKVLPQTLAAYPDALPRFEREALAVAALSHPNILSIFDFGTQDGVTYAVMELLEGETLREKLDAGPIPQKQAVDYVVQVARGLSAAHEKGVVHRDLKPENLFVSKEGHLKILDFGLAKQIEAVAPGKETSAPTASGHTQPGTVMGTVGYMSPEQVRGLPVDHRSDIFSFGVILYELLSGKKAFKRDTAADTMSAILKEEPSELSDSGRNISPALDHVVKRCLEKNRDNRFQSASEIHAELKTMEAAPVLAQPAGFSRRTQITIAAAVVGAALVAGWFWYRASRERSALAQVPEITRLVDAGDYTKAAALLREARAVLPGNAALEKLWMDATRECSVESDPPGADVSIRSYRANPELWETLGQTPLLKVRLPRDFHVWKISKPGFRVAFAISGSALKRKFRLERDDTLPPEMIRVPGDEKVGLDIPGFELAPEIKLDDYLIDRHEVTNEEYKKFVDAGGYANREFWKQPFVRDGRTIPWEQGIAAFRDTTGRPGPATWEVHFSRGSGHAGSSNMP
jgi:eukaryotic-like serine/threonine-protein kinase